jgi:hypothetical protein
VKEAAMQYGLLIPRDAWEPVREVDLANEDSARDLLHGDPLPTPIGHLNLSMLSVRPDPGHRRWANYGAAQLIWFLTGGSVTPIFGDAILVSDEIRGDSVPEPLRRRLLGLGGPFRIHVGLRDDETWFIQGGVQFDYFEAIEEAMDLHRNAAGHVAHIHIARADEVLLW